MKPGHMVDHDGYSNDPEAKKAELQGHASAIAERIRRLKEQPSYHMEGDKTKNELFMEIFREKEQLIPLLRKIGITDDELNEMFPSLYE